MQGRANAAIRRPPGGAQGRAEWARPAANRTAWGEMGLFLTVSGARERLGCIASSISVSARRGQYDVVEVLLFAPTPIVWRLYGSVTCTVCGHLKHGSPDDEG